MRAIQVWPLSRLQELEGERQVGTMGAGTKAHSPGRIHFAHRAALNCVLAFACRVCDG
jgi:hypothetical protein